MRPENLSKSQKYLKNQFEIPRKYIIQPSKLISQFFHFFVFFRNPECDDPFHNNYSLAILESPCMVRLTLKYFV